MKYIQKYILFVLIVVVIFVLAPSAWAYSIRIGLQTRVSESVIGSQGTAIVFLTGDKKKPVIKLEQMQRYNCFARNNKISFRKLSNNKVFNTNASTILIVPKDQNKFMYAKGRWYRGYLKIIARGNYVTTVNVVDIEDYLKSVVASEMPARWNMEALKAQAITARSYAMANLNKRNSEGYDLKDTPQDQAYRGAKKEHYRSILAVYETKGQVLVSGKKIVPAYYHSSSGGMTDNYGWTGPVNFARSVKDFDQQSPRAHWQKNYTVPGLSNRLSLAGINVGTVRNIVPVKKTETGRLKSIRVKGSGGSRIVDVERLQKILSLPSNFFSVYNNGRSIFIRGRGCGHGIGMSQWGAKAMADKGCNAYQILGYYYKNVEVRKITEG